MSYYHQSFGWARSFPSFVFIYIVLSVLWDQCGESFFICVPAHVRPKKINPFTFSFSIFQYFSNNN
jgi:hypothetical protein